jgi:sigma-B regulation protein RsbU (phosphoserine phosphatase)
MHTPSLAGDRTARAAVVLAAFWLVLMVVLDLLLPPSVVPDPLFAIAPLIACSVLPPRTTTLFAAAALLLLVWSGWWNETWATPQQWVRLLDVVLVSLAAVVVSVVREHREQQVRRLTAIAETAQRVILPTVPAATQGLRTASRYLSAAEDAVVGGDLYDCSVTEGYTRFVVGDVRGKGLGAVEHAARVIRAFRQSAATKVALADAARDMDAYLTPFLGEEDFVTALLVDLTPSDTITLVSCGHPPPVLVRPDGSARFLDTPAGLPLGLGSDPEDCRFQWGPGDRMLVYTDGLSEARDGAGEFLRLLDVAPMLATGGLDSALDALLERVRGHVPDGALGDDLAVLLLENTAVPAVGAVAVAG